MNSNRINAFDGKPSKVKFFNGLRVTADHMNHLQWSFYSAIEDFREILGLGKVYKGFDVVAESGSTVRVEPGWAFDANKNRIVCLEPKTLEVEFDQEEDKIYICLKYEQIKNDEVEGQFTRIWDGCSAVVRKSFPLDEENLIPIAILEKSDEGEDAFNIVSLVPDEEKAAVDEEKENETLKEREEVEDSREGQPVIEPELRESQLEYLKLKVKQSVTLLNESSEMDVDLTLLILESLKSGLSAGNSFNGEEVLFILAEKVVPLDFSVTSLTCDSIISANLELNKDFFPKLIPESEDNTSLYTNIKYHSTANGEATFTDNEVMQYGLSTVQTFLNLQGDPQGDSLRCLTSDLTENGIARLPLSFTKDLAKLEGYENIADFLKNFKVIVSIKKLTVKGFKFCCNLIMEGGVNEEMIRRIEGNPLNFSGHIQFAWKAIGIG